MKPIRHSRSSLLATACTALLAGHHPAKATDYNFGSVTGNFTLTATDQARGMGTGTASGVAFNDNGWGGVYDRGADQDATYFHFNLSSLAGATINGTVNLNLTIDAQFGGAINGGIVGSAPSAWSYPGNTPGITTISGADPSGSYSTGQTATAVIDNTTFQGFATDLSTFHGLGITAGDGSTAHFSAPASLTGNATTGMVTVAGGTDWSAAAWNNGTFTLAVSGSSDVSGGNVTVRSGATVSVTDSATLGAGSFSGTFANNGALSFGSSANQTLSGAISGSGTLTKSGAGTLVLSGANSYSTGTMIDGGTLALQNTYASSGFSIASGAALELNVASGERDFATATFSGAGTLRKTGGGKAIWGSSVATFTLGTGSLIDVQEGTFAVGSYANDNMGSSLADLNVAAGATFDSAACDAYVNSLNGAGSIVLAYTNAHPRTLTVGVNNGGGTFSGTISDGTNGGNGYLVKNGSGTQTLSGANTYTGSTTINEGTLALQNTYGTSGFSIASGAVLELNVASGSRDFAVTSGSTFSGTGTLRKTGSGFAHWGYGTANFTLGAGSLIDVQEGTLAIGGYANDNMSASLADLNVAAGASFDSAACDAYVNALNGAGTIVLAFSNSHPRTLTVGVDNGDGTFSGAITNGNSIYGGDGNLVKTGSGTQTLTGINTYTGNTTVNGGSLVLADNAQLKFVVTDSSQNSVTGTGTATFSGDFNIDTSAVTGTNGHMWLLVDKANLDPASSFTSTFTVIGFDDTDNDGIWTMTDAKGDWSFDESTGELTLDIGNDYDAWGSAYNLAAGSEGGDLDSDGLTNGEEYAFGLVPDSGSSVNPIIAPLEKSSGKFTYQRRDNALTGLTYTIWYSTDLATWNEDAGATQPDGAPDGNGVETIAVTLTPALLANTKLFVQVRTN